MYQQNFSINNPSSKKNQHQHQYQTPVPLDSKLIYTQLGIQPPQQKKLASTEAVKIDVDTDPSNEKRSPVWRINFIVVFLPLFLWGFPIHLLFTKKRVYSTREWLKYLCPSPCVSILTIISAISSIMFNANVAYNIGRFLHVLLFTAVLSADLFDIFGELFTLLPFVIPLNLFWMKGYKLANFIASFDRVVLNWKPMDGLPFPKISNGRIKLFILYLMIISVHTLHHVAEYYRNNTGEKIFSSMTVWNQIYFIVFNYSDSVLYTIVLPIYCCFCWAIKYELEMTKCYIQSLIVTRVAPQYDHFDEFKKISRKVIDDVVTTNTIFSITMSVVVVILGLDVFTEAKNIGMTFFNNVLSSFLKGQAPSPTQEVLAPEAVRLIVADAVVTFLYVGLFMITFWQAVQCNDEIRALHIWMNDFVSEPESKLSRELHGNYVLLKWYIHSRLEQEKPALLNISAISMIPVPGLARRLLQYRVRH